MIYEMISYRTGRGLTYQHVPKKCIQMWCCLQEKGGFRLTKGQVSPEASSIDVCFNMGGSLRPIEKHWVDEMETTSFIVYTCIYIHICVYYICMYKYIYVYMYIYIYVCFPFLTWPTMFPFLSPFFHVFPGKFARPRCAATTNTSAPAEACLRLAVAQLGLWRSFWINVI